MANEHAQQGLFRQKSLERVTSPEELNEYIRVANPGVWVLMAAIVILLIGVCVWGVMGHLDTALPAAAVVENGELTVYIKDTEINQVQAGMDVLVNEQAYPIGRIAEAPVLAQDQMSEYALHVGGLQEGQWVYAAQVEGDFADGVYSVEILVDRVSPMSFVVN